MANRLVVYVSPWCMNCVDAQDALREWHVPYTTIDVKQDRAAAIRVRTWTGFESVPTLVIAEESGVEPVEPPAPLAHGASPRGVDRGAMLTEPNRQQLRAWLARHGLVDNQQS